MQSSNELRLDYLRCSTCFLLVPRCVCVCVQCYWTAGGTFWETKLNTNSHLTRLTSVTPTMTYTDCVLKNAFIFLCINLFHVINENMGLLGYLSFLQFASGTPWSCFRNQQTDITDYLHAKDRYSHIVQNM